MDKNNDKVPGLCPNSYRFIITEKPETRVLKLLKEMTNNYKDM